MRVEGRQHSCDLNAAIMLPRFNYYIPRKYFRLPPLSPCPPSPIREGYKRELYTVTSVSFRTVKPSLNNIIIQRRRKINGIVSLIAFYTRVFFCPTTMPHYYTLNIIRLFKPFSPLGLRHCPRLPPTPRPPSILPR